MKCVSKSFLISAPRIWVLLFVCWFKTCCVAGFFFQAGPLNCFHALPAWLWNIANKQSPEQKPTQQNILFSLGVSLGAVSHCCSAVRRQSQNSSVLIFLPWKLSSGGLHLPAPLMREEAAASYSLSFLNFSSLAESGGAFPCPNINSSNIEETCLGIKKYIWRLLPVFMSSPS